MSAQACSLQELSRLAFAVPITWLTPGPTRDDPVNWIAISINEANAGDVMLLPSDQASSRLLNKAQKKGVSPVLVLEKKPSADVILPSDLPIAIISGEHDLVETQRSLLTILINQSAALHERRARIYAQLSQLEAEGKGLRGLVKAMADICGKGLLVQDKRGRILEECTSSALAMIWEDILKQLVSLNSLPESLKDRKKTGSQPVIITQDIPGGLARLVLPITVGEVA